MRLYRPYAPLLELLNGENSKSVRRSYRKFSAVLHNGLIIFLSSFWGRNMMMIRNPNSHSHLFMLGYGRICLKLLRLNRFSWDYYASYIMNRDMIFRYHESVAHELQAYIKIFVIYLRHGKIIAMLKWNNLKLRFVKNCGTHFQIVYRLGFV